MNGIPSFNRAASVSGAAPASATAEVLPRAEAHGKWDAFAAPWGGKLSAQGHTVVSNAYPSAFLTDGRELAHDAAVHLPRFD